ncbi:hypothetical protein [Mucilaginibacter terrae]|uniref:hypothetical protein n=1 Tax=Mucilaginibacter terrae TaxID=1955052 RepID=UPI002897A3A3|nr:hypothetical protein [Mucilaginibacter terrae]
MAAVTGILTVLSVWAAFSKTYSAWKLNRELSGKRANSNNMSYNPAYMERKFKNIEAITALYTADSTTYRNHVLSTVARLADAENIRVIEMPGTENQPNHRTGIYEVQKLGFEGDFFNFTRFYNRIQAASGIGRVRGAQYSLISQPTSTGTRKSLRFYLYLERKI